MKLLPCPFCGETDIRIGYDGIYDRYYAACPNCMARGPEKIGWAERAVQAWNALPRALVWTNEPPSEPGFWWWELLGNKGVDLIKDPAKRVVNDYRAKWAGPIPEPREHK